MSPKDRALHGFEPPLNPIKNIDRFVLIYEVQQIQKHHGSPLSFYEYVSDSMNQFL